MRSPVNIIFLPAFVALFLFSALLSVFTLEVRAAPPPVDETPTLGENRLVHENAVTFWDEVALNAVRFARPGPPIVARSLAIVHTAQYEAWSQYDESAVGSLLGTSYRQPIEKRTLQNKTTAMSYAAYRVLVDLFPTRIDMAERGPRSERIDGAKTSLVHLPCQSTAGGS